MFSEISLPVPSQQMMMLRMGGLAGGKSGDATWASITKNRDVVEVTLVAMRLQASRPWATYLELYRREIQATTGRAEVIAPIGLSSNSFSRPAFDPSIRLCNSS